MQISRQKRSQTSRVIHIREYSRNGRQRVVRVQAGSWQQAIRQVTEQGQTSRSQGWRHRQAQEAGSTQEQSTGTNQEHREQEQIKPQGAAPLSIFYGLLGAKARLTCAHAHTRARGPWLAHAHRRTPSRTDSTSLTRKETKKDLGTNTCVVWKRYSS